MMWPQPRFIKDFPPLPISEKSTLAGDTWQIPNVVGYFSNNYRDFVIPYYSNIYKNISKFFFAPIRINYPPEFAFTAIKKHTDSTYLEELVYPLRNSIYINGFEPFYQDGQPKFWGSTKLKMSGKAWETKVTLRFYPSPIWVRITIWFGIILSSMFLWKLTKKI